MLEGRNKTKGLLFEHIVKSIARTQQTSKINYCCQAHHLWCLRRFCLRLCFMEIKTNAMNCFICCSGVFNPFLANVLILYPLKTPENQRYKMGALARNRLISKTLSILIECLINNFDHDVSLRKLEFEQTFKMVLSGLAG